MQAWFLDRGAGRPRLGVMGIQDKGDVVLVRHAYVAPATQRSGVGTSLLRHAESLVDKPILIGTWAAASWAIGFYERNGFTLVPTKRRTGCSRNTGQYLRGRSRRPSFSPNARWLGTNNARENPLGHLCTRVAACPATSRPDGAEPTITSTCSAPPPRRS
jgi:hypothetical protein